MMGTLIKTYFAAQKLGISPDKIVNVSIMPCVAKKDEIARPQLRMNVPNGHSSTFKSIPETDYVLTTRELGHLIERERIPFASLEDSDYDSPLGVTTGAAALFGATGGVMEAALRTAYEVITKERLKEINFHAVRGFDSVRSAEVQIGEKTINVAVVHGTSRVRQMVESVLSGDKTYHFIEVMACPGGCVGGGGEPKTSVVDPDVIKKRIAAIYSIDERKYLRRSHENPGVQEVYKNFIKGEPNSKEAHAFLHTHYTDRSNEVKVSTDTPFGMPPTVPTVSIHDAKSHN